MAKKPLLSPKNDFVFKSIFADPKNDGILADFLQSVIDLPPEEYDSLTIVDPNLRIEDENDKTAIMDIKLKTKSGKVIDIEIQLCNHSYLKERIVYYTSKMITEQINAGDNYNKIKNAITILITDFTLIKDSDAYKSVYCFRSAEGSVFSDIMQIVLIELSKTPKETDYSKLYDWLWFLRAESEEEFMELAARNPQIKRATVIVQRLSGDERERAIAEAKHKRGWDIWGVRQDGITEGRAEGMEAGIAKGMEEKSFEIAKKLKKMGLSLEHIQEATGLSEEIINTL